MGFMVVRQKLRHSQINLYLLLLGASKSFNEYYPRVTREDFINLYSYINYQSMDINNSSRMKTMFR
jgi:hypothetical protein